MSTSSPTLSKVKLRIASRLQAFRYWPRPRVPSFAVSYIASATMLLLLFIWIFADPYFASTLHFALIDLGLRSPSADPFFIAIGFWDVMAEKAHRWNALGLRIVVLFVLSVIAICSLIIVAIRLFLGDGIGRTLRGWALSVALFAGWLGLWVSYGGLQSSGLLMRTRHALPRFKAAAEPLVAHWPIEHGTLPEAGLFYAYPSKRPDLILLRTRRGYAMHETFGYKIERTPQGGFRFSLASTDNNCVEFHPAGNMPSSYTDSFGDRHELMNSQSLEDAWYLARYNR